MVFDVIQSANIFAFFLLENSLINHLNQKDLNDLLTRFNNYLSIKIIVTDFQIFKEPLVKKTNFIKSIKNLIKLI